jgi:hypothetical protein
MEVIMHKNMYLNLGLMIVLMFVAMFVLMYAMVDVLADVYPNFNQFYMAGLMTAPMVVIELALMWSMYRNAQANMAILAVSIIAGIACFVAIRQQTAVGDTQFLKSMIPHHSSAILMCEKASIDNAKVKDLCKQIIVGQKAEIAQMKTLLSADKE